VKRCRPLGAIVLVLAVLAIGVATLAPGEIDTTATPLTCLVCGSEGGADVARNILLFLPFGAALALLGVRLRVATLLALALTLAVESAQLWLVPGRDPTLSDVLSNTLGGLLGFLLVAGAPLWLRPTRTQARRLAAAGTLLWLAQLALTAAGLQWAPPAAPYLANVIPPAGSQMRAFEGQILERSVDGAPSATGFDGGAVESGLRGARLTVDATVRPTYPPGMLRPLVVYFSRAWEPVLVVGQQGRDLLLRARTRSQVARFRGPTFRLAGIFPTLEEQAAAHDGSPPIRVGAQLDGPVVRLTSRDERGVTRTAELPRRVSRGWTLIAPDFAAVRPFSRLIDALWFAALLLPIAYWWRPTLAPGGRATAACTLLTASGMLGAAWCIATVAGLSNVAGTDIAAALLAILLGCVAAGHRPVPEP
jgi:hypothetical protein